MCGLTLSHHAAPQNTLGDKNTATRHNQKARIWAPLPLPIFDFPKLKPSIPKEMVTTLRVNGTLVALERTSLRSVQKRLGGTFGSEGDASDYVQWLCFGGTTDEQRWVLWLESGEIDGGKVGEFQLRRIAADAKLDSRCEILKNASGIELPFSLHLGMTEDEVLKALGKPTARKRDSLIYQHHHVEIIHNEPYDSDNSVVVALRDGVVWALQVWKTVQS